MEIDIDYDGLKAVIDRVHIRMGAQFEYQGTVFNVFTYQHTKSDEREGDDPFFWKADSALGGYDLYLALNVGKKEFRRPILLHETLEAFLAYACLEECTDEEEGFRMVHEIATRYDEQYARERLSEGQFREYLTFKKGLHGFLGGNER